MARLPVGRCQYCRQLLVVMNTASGSVLPVEVNSKEVEIDDSAEFDKALHRSHLLTCQRQRDRWDKKKWKYIKERNPFNRKGKEADPLED